MGADTHDPDKLRLYPWDDLLKRERREMLVDDLLFTTGVTTLVAPSGEGKTTVAISAALAVDKGMWGNKLIKRRPVLWVAGEGQDDLRPMYEANRHHLRNSQSPQGGFFEEAIDLSSDSETNKLIRLLEGMPPALIVTDALADMIGDLNEDKSQDMNRVYRNVWRVIRKNNGCFLIPHHAGWNKERERGSTAIRAKSDIVVQITSFEPEAGVVELKHNKRRGGAKLERFYFGIKLVPVSGYPQPIPIITGPKTELELVLETPLAIDETERHARELVQVMLQHFPDGATYAKLGKQSGMSDSTFKRAFGCARGLKWFVGGGGRGQRYNLNPNECWKSSGSTSGPTSTPSRGVDVLDPKEVTAMDPTWTQVGPLNPNTSCKNVDTTASTEKSNEIKESKSFTSEAEKAPPSDDDLIKEGINATKKVLKTG